MVKKNTRVAAKASRSKSRAGTAVAKKPALKRAAKPVAKPAAKAAAPAKPAPKPAPVPVVKAAAVDRKSAELEEFRQLLLSLRARVRGDVEQMTNEALDRNGDGTESKSPTHLAELGTETYEQDFALRRVENEQELLDEVGEALARIERGTFGQCLSCLESGIAPAKAQIPKARLRVIPYARNCVECERKRERWGR
jgi:DnaK suppressor protein